MRALVGSADGLNVVGEAQSGADAVAQALQTRRGVVLMDLNMPGLRGVEATRRIVAAHPQSRVFLTMKLRVTTRAQVIVKAREVGMGGDVRRGG